MKKFKTVFFLFACILISNLLHAQAFDDGKNLLSLGFGFPATTEITQTVDQYKSYTDYRFKNYGTVILKYEHGLQKYFGIGLNLEYSGASISYKYDDQPLVVPPRYQVNIKSSVFGAYVRLNGHFPIGDNFDIYGGAGLGYLYQVNNYADDNPNPNSTISHKTSIFDFDYQLTIGARYMVKKGFGLFCELGKATTNAQLGIVLGF